MLLFPIISPFSPNSFHANIVFKEPMADSGAKMLVTGTVIGGSWWLIIQNVYSDKSIPTKLNKVFPIETIGNCRHLLVWSCHAQTWKAPFETKRTEAYCNPNETKSIIIYCATGQPMTFPTLQHFVMVDNIIKLVHAHILIRQGLWFVSDGGEG